MDATQVAALLKGGFKTSEFWLSLVSLLSVLFMQYVTRVDTLVAGAQTHLMTQGAIGMLAASLLSGLYALGRSYMKGAALKATAAVAVASPGVIQASKL